MPFTQVALEQYASLNFFIEPEDSLKITEEIPSHRIPMKFHCIVSNSGTEVNVLNYIIGPVSQA